MAAILLLAGCTTPAPADAGPPRDAAGLLAWCAPRADPPACVQDALQDVMRAEGAGAAFALLANVTALDGTAGDAHQWAHALGRFALDLHGDVHRAMAACPPGMGSGCLHGVVEAHLARSPPDAPLEGLCVADGPKAQHLVHQCWHGVGHGLLMAFDGDWIQAGGRCMGIASFEDQVNCGSGVFMQNLVDEKAGAHVHGTHGVPRILPEDILFPCDQLVPVALLVGCWQVQPGVVLLLRGGNLTAAFEACAQAGAYALACESGIGQVVAAQERIDGRSALAACELAPNQTASLHCMRSVVMESINHAGDLQAGLDRCAVLLAAVVAYCYQAVGDMHVALESRPEARAERCLAVPEAHRQACAEGTPRETP
ncbi:MAG: hypothetical protein QOD77_1696 [Thermoplasmata archaeon]|jgi:hypothetical protein|nr:hypothetical protein [Thermoplasmata archaeon]